MKNLTNYLTLIALTLCSISSISSCNNNPKETKVADVEPTFNLATAKEEIVTANKEFMALFAAGDSTGLANLYAQGGKIMMNGAAPISGTENLQSTFSAIMKSGITSVDLRTIEVWGTEGLITEEGALSLFAGETEADQGKYIVLWKKEDGKWKFFRDIFNSNLPAQ